MKRNGSKIRKLIKSPSIPEVKLRLLSKELYPSSEHTYKILNYEVDIAIPELKIVIEYDGSYWHQDKEKDLKRQKEIEAENWKFIRYLDEVPTKERLKKDILKLLAGI